MEFHYEVIAKMAADIAKQMLRLNIQLDRVIDRQNELADPKEQQSVAIALINDLKWDEASKLCAEQAREEDKRIKLDGVETQLRSELEALREQLVRVSKGEEVAEPPAADEAGEADKE